MAISSRHLGQVLIELTRQLTGHSETARMDAEILLTHVMQIGRTRLYTHPDAPMGERELSQLSQLLQRRLAGQPIAYLIGYKDFWSLRLKVSESTLIPRPETELLVELTLSRLHSLERARILDLGTGSGAIALALAKEKPNWTITASDMSLAALDIARQNAEAHSIDNVNFVHSHWFDAITPQAYDLIVSNPPYIAESDPHLTQGDLRFEPTSALMSPEDGLADIRTIIQSAPQYLCKGGSLLIEHGYRQKDAILAIMRKRGFSQLTDSKDINNLDRVVAGIIESRLLEFADS